MHLCVPLLYWVVVISIIKDVSTMRCLSCQAVVQPRHCTVMETCALGEVCYVEKYQDKNGEYLFNVGCAATLRCISSRSVEFTNTTGDGPAYPMCTQCCETDLCNNYGCDEPGWPQRRGPVCLNCHQSMNLDKCDAISVCRQDELCHFEEILEFGDIFYKTRCLQKNLCHQQFINSPIIGKRDSRTVSCFTCCEGDLCNNRCGDITAVPTESNITCVDLSSDCSFYKEQLHICDNTEAVRRLGCNRTCNMCGGTPVVSMNATLTTVTKTPTSSVSTTQNPNGHNLEEEYLLMFLQNVADHVTLEAMVLSNKTTSMTIESQVKGVSGIYHIPKGVYHLHLPKELVMQNSDNVTHKSVLLKTNSSVAVFGFNHDECCASDGYLAIPVSKLGTSYVVGTYYDQRSLVAIGAVEDNTTVTITLPANSGPVPLLGQTYNAGDLFNVTLNRLETYLVSKPGDLTGTQISSDKKVAVISGNKCALLDDINCNHFVEFLPPVSKWGTQFLVPPVETTTAGLIKIIPLTETFNVTVSRAGNQTSYIAPTTDGYIEFSTNSNEPYYIQSTEPVLVLQFSKFEGQGVSPFMTQVPSLGQLTNNADVSTPNVTQYTNYATISIETKYVDGLLFNYHPLRSLNMVGTIRMLNTTANGQQTSYSFITLRLGEGGVNNIRHTDPNVKFSVVMYGFGYYESYAYPASLNI